MEFARSAMERIPLTQDSTSKPSLPIPQPPADSVDPAEDAPRILLPFSRHVLNLFRAICHTLGALFLRLLSTLMLHFGILAAVISQLISFYYTGVLNINLLISVLLYAPALGGMAVIRGHILQQGTSASGAAPRMSHMVALAYLVMTVCGILSILQPVVMRLEGRLSNKGMWISLAGTGVFYYCLLVSEVLFATALNVQRAKEIDEELDRREREDPAWMTGYQAIHSAEV